MLLRKKEEIEKLLNHYHIYQYELISNEEYGYVINVNGNVIINNYNLKSIPFKFNKINGSFNCSHNQLESLKGCPEIVTGEFRCNHNKLKSLEGCPKIVYKNFICNNNNLDIEGLKYLPKIENNYIEINNNSKLKELQKIHNFNKLKEKVDIIFIKKEQEILLNNMDKEKLKKNTNKI